MSIPLTLNYKELGTGDPVVILHGLFGSSANWGSISRQLAPHYRVISADLRNHGTSPHAGTMDYDEMAADVLELLDTLELEHTTLVGHSMGGKVAMVLSLRHTVSVKRLAIVDIAPIGYGHQFGDIIDAIKALPLARLSSRRQADQLLSEKIQDPVLRQFLLQNLRSDQGDYQWRINLDAIETNVQTIIGFPEFGPDSHYPGPACFIRGESSHYIRAEHHERIRSLFPQAKVHDVPGAGHWPHTERPDRFLPILLDFLGSDRA